MNPKLYLALVHYPVKNKRDEVVTTSVTNLDLHDIARTATTFGFERYDIINPLVPQHQHLKRIMGHWESEEGASYNPDRQEAFHRVHLSFGLEQTLEEITAKEGVAPAVITTSARPGAPETSEQEVVKALREQQRPGLVLFGTGWGLVEETIAQSDFFLPPIFGPGEYNHLSVRSAVAIYADRLHRGCNYAINPSS